MAFHSALGCADDHGDGQEAADEHNGDDPATVVSSPKGAQRAKDRIAELIARGCGNQEPRDHVKELDSWYTALARLAGTSEAISITISICKGKADEGRLADSDVVIGWLKSIRGTCSKKPRGKKGRGGRRSHSPIG